MLSKTYDALKAAGAPAEKAREAAEELAGYENRLASIDGRLASLEGKFTVMLWAMGINASAAKSPVARLAKAAGEVKNSQF